MLFYSVKGVFEVEFLLKMLLLGSFYENNEVFPPKRFCPNWLNNDDVDPAVNPEKRLGLDFYPSERLKVKG